MAKPIWLILLVGCMGSAASGHANAYMTPRETASLINAVDTLDQAATDILQGNKSRLEFDSKTEQQQKLMDVEFAIDHSLGLLYSEPGVTISGAQMVAGLHVGIINRRLLDNRPLTSKLPQQSTRPECRADMSLGRTHQRYSRAFAKMDSAEQFLLLMDYQNALNCLGALEARVLAMSTGASLRRWSNRLEDSTWTVQRKRQATNAVLNPSLMLFDLTKYQGHSWLFFWLHETKTEYPGIANDIAQIYLNDFFTGSLVSFNTRGQFDLNSLIDPRNIGMGACSLLEMVGSAQRGGSFACARGLSCSADDTLATSEIGSSRQPQGMSLPGESLSAGGQNPFKRPESDIDVTPFGLPQTELASNCGGAGSTQGVSDLIGSMAADTLIGCIGESLTSMVNDNNGQCLIDAGLTGNRDQPNPVLGTGAGGLPVVIGVIGGSNCESDPRAQDQTGNSNSSAKQCTDNFDCAKQDAQDFYRSAKGTRFVKQLLLDAIDAREDALRDLSLLSGGSSVLSNANVDALNAERENARNNAATYADTGAQAIDNALAKQGLAVSKGVLGNTRDTGIEVDAGHPSHDSMQATLEHEAAHAILNVFFGTSPASSLIDHHGVMKKQPDVYENRWAVMTESVIDWVKDQLKKHEEGGEDDGEGTDGVLPTDGRQQPDIENPPCTAMTESFQNILACRNPITTPFGQSGEKWQAPFQSVTSRLGDTFLTPKPDDGNTPTGNQLEDLDSFQSCYAKYGMDPIGVDGKGRLVIGARNDRTSRQCGTINCAPPAAAKSVEGICCCVGPAVDLSRVMREQWASTYCYTSDACLPKHTQIDGKSFATHIEELTAEMEY